MSEDNLGLWVTSVKKEKSLQESLLIVMREYNHFFTQEFWETLSLSLILSPFFSLVLCTNVWKVMKLVPISFNVYMFLQIQLFQLLI